jgi:hypothetical protein
MGKYGECAVVAVDRITSSLEEPKTAWKNAAASVFPRSKTSQDKGCPKGAFLGLCGEGLVKGVRRGQYTTSKDNKRYALEAIKLLKETPRLGGDPDALWRAVPGHPLHENGQMEVVISLWSRSLIV